MAPQGKVNASQYWNIDDAWGEGDYPKWYKPHDDKKKALFFFPNILIGLLTTITSTLFCPSDLSLFLIIIPFIFVCFLHRSTPSFTERTRIAKSLDRYARIVRVTCRNCATLQLGRSGLLPAKPSECRNENHAWLRPWEAAALPIEAPDSYIWESAKIYPITPAPE